MEDAQKAKLTDDEAETVPKKPRLDNVNDEMQLETKSDLHHRDNSKILIRTGENTQSEGAITDQGKERQLAIENNQVCSLTEGKTPEEISMIRKKKVALLLSYCGAGFFGMQKNPGVNTIEDELMNALSKSGAVKPELKDDFGKLSFQRCARTDKGVSATRQVVSLKMVPIKELLPSINGHLPPSIRVFGMIRVTKGFDSKNHCGARTYEYLAPSFSFAPTEMLTVPSFRIKEPQIERVNSILKMMCGTHNFHNYTSGKSPNEASAKRYIIEFTAGQPFVRNGHEFMAILVKGQSFMLHQIRKMIGLCIAICRGFCGEEVIEKSWGKEKMDIPKAPGLGLILDTVHFDRYNERYGSDGIHEQISWEKVEKEVRTFKESYIWDTIIESEITHNFMQKWLKTLKNHTYSENRIHISETKELEKTPS